MSTNATTHRPETVVATILALLFVGAITLFVLLVAGEVLLAVLAAAGVIAAAGALHYVAWGRSLTRETAEERRRRQVLAEMEEDAPPPGSGVTNGDAPLRKSGRWRHV
jgi:hypothetical protein